MKKKLKIIIPIIILILLLIVGAVVFALNYKLPKEKVLEKANEASSDEINSEIYENKVRAEEKYIGNYYKIDGFVTEIEGDQVTLECSSKMSELIIKLKMSKDEIKLLDNSQKVKVVGKITSITSEEREEQTGFKTKEFIIEIENGYLVEDKFKIGGIVEIPSIAYVHGNEIYLNKWYCAITDIDNKYNVYNITDCATEKKSCAAIIAGTELKDKDIVAIEGKIYKFPHYFSNKRFEYKIKDVKIIKNEK